jgi:hypothetical protein
LEKPRRSNNDFFESNNLSVFSGIGLRFISEKIYNAIFRIDYGFKIYDGKKIPMEGWFLG